MWRPFRKSSPAVSADAAWWRDASTVADAPAAAAIDALEQRATAERAEDVDTDRRREMIAGLRQLIEIASEPDLPTVVTQHRVIGADACHFIAPASRVAETDSSGKLFLTSTRVVLVTGGVAAWPWHRVTSVARIDRDVVFTLSGAEPLQVRLNTFGEALIVRHVSEQLSSRRASAVYAGQSRI